MTTINNLKDQIITLQNDKKNLQHKIENIDHELNKKIIEVSKLCNNHKWKIEREDGIYGEKYVYCEKCGIDCYNNLINHFFT